MTESQTMSEKPCPCCLGNKKTKVFPKSDQPPVDVECGYCGGTGVAPAGG